MSGMRPPSSFITAEAEVGEIRPKRFALGAAIGRPSSLQTARKTGCALWRTATVGSPLVTKSGTSACFGKINVSGPGQNAAVSLFTVSAIS